MQVERKARIMASCLVAATLAACGGGSSSDEGAAGAPNGPLEPTACLISADCPASAHCDLGECVRDCDVARPCDEGRTCSARARCLAQGELDADPPPSTELVGKVTTPEQFVSLNERSVSLVIPLEATGVAPVRYRVEVSGQHLAAPAPRGEFTGSTTLFLPVDTSKVAGQEAAGTARIFTTLGDLVVNAPLRAGFTGVYRGSMRYGGLLTALGHTRFALDLREADGKVKARVRRAESLLFPYTMGGDVTGQSARAPDGSLEIAFDQRIEADDGGESNVFRRPLGRRLLLRLRPNERDQLVGTFEESLYGLFPQPIKQAGGVTLDYQAGSEVPDFTLTAAGEMPTSSAFAPKVGEVFAWTEEPQSCDGFDATDTFSLQQLTANAALPLRDAMAALSSASGADPLLPIAQACEDSLEAKQSSDYEGTAAKDCVFLRELACCVVGAAAGSAADVARGKVLGLAVAALAAPALLVAKDKAVRGLEGSFRQVDASPETEPYIQATDHLRRTATWLLQPAVLGALRALGPEAARGDGSITGTTTQAQAFPAARALADLIATTAALDGELGRVQSAQEAVGVTDATATGDAARELQKRALFVYLEGAALGALLENWAGLPETVTGVLTGVLTPLDRSFVALLEGAAAFGVPAGVAPFLYDASDASSGSTNFAQVLSVAREAVADEANAEQVLLARDRAYEASATDLSPELDRARTYFDNRLRQLCGATFDPDAMGLVEAWEACGAVPDGIVGELRADIALANRRLLAAQTRVNGMARKIAISQDAIARPRGERSDNLYFLHPNGYTVNVSALTGETLAATQRLVQAISRAQPFDASVLAGEGSSLDVSDTQLKAVRGEAQVAHDVLLAAQTMRAPGVVNTPELGTGMHDLQKQCVELTQLRAEVMVDGVGVLEAGLRLHNALHEAKALSEERRRALALVGLNPATDPAFRLVRDRAALDVLATRARAQRQLYLAGRALEYEMNTPLPFLERAALRARSAPKLGALSSCLQGIADGSRAASEAAQDYSTDVSVRQMLGIVGPRRDEVTGLEMSEGEQFRRMLLQNPNFDGLGGVSLRFPTAWWHDARLWPEDVCDDRISSVSAQLVGRNLGNSAAEIRLTTSGGAVVQACGTGADMRAWFTGAGDSVGEERLAVLKAGVSSLDQAPPSNAFFGQSVARAAWELVLPGDAEAPSNRDLNLGALEDVVLRIKHRARAVNVTTPPIDLSCLRGG